MAQTGSIASVSLPQGNDESDKEIEKGLKYKRLGKRERRKWAKGKKREGLNIE